MEFEDIIEEIVSFFCGDITYHGILNQTQVRDGNVGLRKINHVNNFTPITYNGGNMMFAVANDSLTVDRYKNVTVAIKVVLITTDWYNLGKVIDLFNMDRTDTLTVDMDSLGVYERYFGQNNDKPFTEYAFEFAFNVNDSVLKL